MLLPLVSLTLTAYRFLDYYCIPKYATNEPPVVYSSIPYIRYIIRLL